MFKVLKEDSLTQSKKISKDDRDTSLFPPENLPEWIDGGVSDVRNVFLREAEWNYKIKTKSIFIQINLTINPGVTIFFLYGFVLFEHHFVITYLNG